jgi:hypothetical protein
MAYKVNLPPQRDNRETISRVSHPPKAGDSGDGSDERGENQPREHLSHATRTGSSPSPNGVSQDRTASPKADKDRYENPRSDPYWQAATNAQTQITELGWEISIGEWLEKVHPRLYHDIYDRIPHEIDALWETDAPFEQFKAVLRQWVEAHRAAVNQWHARTDLTDGEGHVQGLS